MRTILATLFVLGAFNPLVAIADDDDVRRGAELYRACVSCHALEPGLHTSGPSLAGLIGRPAGRVNGFVRYSPGLRDAEFDWDRETLDAWLADPQLMIPGTYMAFNGMADAAARADLVAFLVDATAPDGLERMTSNGLIPDAYIRGAAPTPLTGAPDFARVTKIRHCGDSYFISTADGVETPMWEKNVRLKIDSASTGPPTDMPVVVQSGMRGDRVSVVFSSVAELQTLIAEEC